METRPWLPWRHARTSLRSMKKQALSIGRTGWPLETCEGSRSIHAQGGDDRERLGDHELSNAFARGSILTERREPSRWPA